jgi:cation:H+ antiporter
MSLWMIGLYIVAGGSILTWGADLFVKSASLMARILGIPSIIIGLTVVAFGTSAPELAVNILSVFRGQTDIAMGNVVGSNILNVGLILGLCALIQPLRVNPQLIKIDLPFVVLISVLTYLIGRDLFISLGEGLLLVAGLIAYLAMQVKLSRLVDIEETEEASELDGSKTKTVFQLILGFAMLVGGASLFVEGAVQGALYLGWSERIISLTIVSLGTSLPEIATSVAATLKGERDIAIGNVLGSNIFNILAVLGFSASISGNIPIAPSMVNFDLPVMIFLVAFCLPFAFFRQELGRIVGGVLIGTYIVYTVVLITVG